MLVSVSIFYECTSEIQLSSEHWQSVLQVLSLLFPAKDARTVAPGGSNLYDFSKSSGFSLISCDKCSQGGPCFKNRCAVGKSIRDLSAWNGYEVSDFAFQGGGLSNVIEGTDAAKVFGFPLTICVSDKNAWIL
jgi:hypothetical protein